MSQFIFYFTAKDIGRLKHAAKDLKRKLDIPHHEALDRVAKQLGLNHWKHVCERADALQALEEAYYYGCVVAMNWSEAGDRFGADGMFIPEQELETLCQIDLMESLRNAINPEDPQGRSYGESFPDDALEEFFRESVSDFIYFRLSPHSKAKTVRQVLRLARTRSFWPPVFIWLQGEMYYTGDEPARNRTGQVVGIKF